MPHVITQPCCADASCITACPVNCIHPAPGEPGFGTTDMLFIDPVSCVDCGACVTACPVGAILPGDKLDTNTAAFAEINASFYDGDELPRAPLAIKRVVETAAGDLNVAIVGSGPAGMYAADEVLRHPGARVTIFERDPEPFGLARWGVAPDHTDTKRILDLFVGIANHPRVTFRTGTPVTDPNELDFDAVVWAAGAANDRDLGLPGAVPSLGIVKWYNGYPGMTPPDLSHRHAIVIGNGNVALDIARVLTGPVPDGVQPDVARALNESEVEVVTVVGRRGPEHAAFTLPELLGVKNASTDRVYEGDDPKIRALNEIAGRTVDGRRVELVFGMTPTEILPDRVVFDGGIREIPAGLVVSAIGYERRANGFVPAIIDHDRGRVCPGLYVTGWAKRGPSGVIGTNKACARETVDTLFSDLLDARPAAPVIFV